MEFRQENKIGIIDLVRGVAALSVCLFHFGKSNVNYHDSSRVFVSFTSYGWLGVQMFFVVSGFIIPYSLHRSGYSSRNFLRFFYRRCVRIEPPYIASIILVIILGYLSALSPEFGGRLPHFDWRQVLLHLGYLPCYFNFDWLLPVYWTLEIEFQYYILIGLLFSFIWRGQWQFMIFVAISWLLCWAIGYKIFEFLPFFIFGMAACARRQGMIGILLFWAFVSISFSVLVITSGEWLPASVGLITALLINYANATGVVVAFFGEISYSLYLIHVPVGGRILNYFGRYADTNLKIWVLLLLALIITIVVARIFYILIERPSLRLSKKISYSHS